MAPEQREVYEQMAREENAKRQAGTKKCVGREPVGAAEPSVAAAGSQCSRLPRRASRSRPVSYRDSRSRRRHPPRSLCEGFLDRRPPRWHRRERHATPHLTRARRSRGRPPRCRSRAKKRCFQLTNRRH